MSDPQIDCPRCKLCSWPKRSDQFWPDGICDECRIEEMSIWKPMTQTPPEFETLLLWISNDERPAFGHRDGSRFYEHIGESIERQGEVKPSFWVLLDKPQQNSCIATNSQINH